MRGEFHLGLTPLFVDINEKRRSAPNAVPQRGDGYQRIILYLILDRYFPAVAKARLRPSNSLRLPSKTLEFRMSLNQDPRNFPPNIV